MKPNLQNKYIFKLYYLVLLLAFAPNSIFSQSKTKTVSVVEKNLGRNAIAAGITTNRVFGISAQSMFSFDENVTSVGGSFNGAQPGIEFRYTYDLDENGDFRFPIGLNYEFFSSREKIPVPPVIEVKLQHNLEIISPYVGLEYRFFKLPRARAYVYGGIDFRAAMVNNVLYTNIIENLRDPEETVSNSVGKENATRYGVNYRIGVEGEISNNYEINASAGLNVMNIFGKDGNRGELLTPIPRNIPVSTENQESIVYGLYVSILLQYRF